MNRTKKWFRDLFRRRMFVAFLILLQFLLIFYFIISGSNSIVINILLKLISILVALHIVAKKDKSAYKLTWIFLILLFISIRHRFTCFIILTKKQIFKQLTSFAILHNFFPDSFCCL